MPRPIAFFVAVSLAVGVGACAHRAPARTDALGDDGPVLIGWFGGEHVQLTARDTGATITYDCAHGAITEPIHLAADGSFAASGWHVFDQGGPVRPADAYDAHLARYDGRVDGTLMRLHVTLVDPPRDLGTFILSRAEPGRIIRCRS